jgi:hypothetical protein
MPHGACSSKRECQYDHINEGLLEQGDSEDLAEEIAARTVNQGTSSVRRGEAIEPGVDEGHLLGKTRWVAISSGPGRLHPRSGL